MASDAHAHPYYLARLCPEAEAERLSRGIRAAASAFGEREFLWNEARAKEAAGAPLALSFGFHPQLPAHRAAGGAAAEETLAFLERLARERRICGVGEAGFDLYDERYRASEREQEAVFRAELEIALRYRLPLTLHIRRAVRKVFEFAAELRSVRAVVFHAWPGAPEECAALLRKGINAFFSFGTAIACGHKNAIRSCAALDGERLLFETDAPYQPPRGKPFSNYADIYTVLKTAAAIRNEPWELVEARSDALWTAVFGAAV